MVEIPTKIGLKIGDSGNEVGLLQIYLKRFGYIASDQKRVFGAEIDLQKATQQPTPNIFEKLTEEALKHFQEFYKLPITGVLDHQTIELMQIPRCGLPDFFMGKQVDFQVHGGWGNLNITYRLENFSSRLTQNEARSAIQDSLREFSFYVPLNFTELGTDADIMIRWAVRNHGGLFDGAFDGQFGETGHSWYPEDGACHFDDEEAWTTIVPTPPGRIDFPSVAIHELGHILGLGHSRDRNAVMFAFFNYGQTPKRLLLADDIDGIRLIYSWHGWEGVRGGGLSPRRPVAIQNAEGQIEVFAVANTGQVFASRRRSIGIPSNWRSQILPFNASIQSHISVARNQDGRLELFGFGRDHSIWHSWRIGNGDEWSNWAPLGNLRVGVIVDSEIALGLNEDGRLELFVRGTDNAIWHVWQTSRNNGWSNWASLGGLSGAVIATGDPAVGVNEDGRLELFVRGTDNAIWHVWQTSRNNGWSNWASRGGTLTGNPAVGRNQDGRLEVFARGNGNQLYHLWQTSQINAWSNWASLGGVVGDFEPSVVLNSDGQLEVYIMDISGNNISRRWQGHEW